MENEAERWAGRRQQIGDRIAAIRARIGELREAQQVREQPVSSSGQLAEAQHHAAVSEAAAQQALDASIDAFRRAAEAHERLAVQYEEAAASRDGDRELNRQRAASHRAAAAADWQRAEAAQSLLASRPGNSPRED